MPTQQQIADHLDLSERKVRDILANLGIDHRQTCMDDIRVAYIRDLREKAGGRGGEEHAALTRARTQQALADADMKLLQYHRELQNLIPANELETALRNWATMARSEVQFAIEKIIAGVQSRFGIEIDQELIDDSLTPAYRAIGRYPTQPDSDADAGRGSMDTRSSTTDA